MVKFFFALSLGVLVGCTGLQPVGPMAKVMRVPPGHKGGDKDKDAPPDPVTVPAAKPTPPLNTVGPEDVAENPYLAVEKTRHELEADRMTIPVSPTTVQVSRVSGGAK